MSFDKPNSQEPESDKKAPDNQRTVFLDALGQAIAHNWPELRAEVLAAESGKPMRLLVTCTEGDAREEVGCDFDRGEGWVFVWLWGEEKPQRIGRAGTVERVARTVASVMGLKTVEV